MNKWSRTSEKKLSSCHPDLIAIMNQVLEVQDCTIIAGGRNEKAQEKAFYMGKSKLKFPQSKHNTVPSQAVDVAMFKDGQVQWDLDNAIIMSRAIYNVWQSMLADDKVACQLRFGLTWTDNPFDEIKEGQFVDGFHIEIV